MAERADAIESASAFESDGLIVSNAPWPYGVEGLVVRELDTLLSWAGQMPCLCRISHSFFAVRDSDSSGRMTAEVVGCKDELQETLAAGKEGRAAMKPREWTVQALALINLGVG